MPDLGRQGEVVDQQDVLAQAFQDGRHADLAPHGVAVRSNVADQQEPLMGADDFNKL